MRRLLGLAIVLGQIFAASQSVAEPAVAAGPASDAARSEARTRFDRGLGLFEKNHDAPAALAELLRAYELVPAPRTLFVMGLVYAAMNRPADALHALDEVVRHPGDLTAAQRDVARVRRDEQKKKVGFLRIDSNVPAHVQVDGLSRGRTPLEIDLPVAAGLRVVTLESPGYLTARRETLVAGEALVPLSFVLEPATVAAPRLVHVTVNVPDVEILVDGAVVGRSPIERALAVDGRAHVIEARRPCYVPASKPIPAASAPAPEALSLRLALAGGSCPRGRLSVRVSEPSASVSVDDEVPAAVAGPLELPAGRHDLVVTRAGFVPSSFSVDLPVGREIVSAVLLVPTAEVRASYEEHAGTVRWWGRALVVGGAAVAVAGGILTALEWTKALDAQRDRDRIFASFANGQPCDPFGATYRPACDTDLGAANANVHRQELWRGLSIATAAVGLAGAVVGAALWAAGPDPRRYERTSPSASTRVRPSARGARWWPLFGAAAGAGTQMPPAPLTGLGGIEGVF